MENFREQKRRVIYRTIRWKELRKSVLKRDKFSCTSCRHIVPSNAHVDHIIPITPSNLFDSDITFNADNLQTLCHKCHNKKTGYEKSAKCEYISANDVNYEKRESW